MNTSKVVKIDKESVTFNNGYTLFSSHKSDCCEYHYLDFSNLSIDDFEGLEFDLESDDFFERVVGYGIALKPIHGHPVRVPGYGYNNGYYSENLTLVLEHDDVTKIFDITNCQVVTDKERSNERIYS